MKINNNRRYNLSHYQKGDVTPQTYIERDGILLHPECREGLFLNAHPCHWAQDEEEYREVGSTRDFGPHGRGRMSDSQVK